jgi:hypothetical protein
LAFTKELSTAKNTGYKIPAIVAGIGQDWPDSVTDEQNSSQFHQNLATIAKFRQQGQIPEPIGRIPTTVIEIQ